MILMLLAACAAAGAAHANTLCEAKNDHGDSCKASCPAGQQAYCANAKSDQPPSCRCLSDEHPQEDDADDPEEPVVLLAAARRMHARQPLLARVHAASVASR